jgi:hypothetical protein
MFPFDQYPYDGVNPLPKHSETNARHGYGLELQKITGQNYCVYCGISLVDNYYHWLLLSVDHVIPISECKRLEIPEIWAKSYSNLVLCCSGCNGFDNRYKLDVSQYNMNWTFKEFCNLRNKVFQERQERIQYCRNKELQFYNTHPWK